MGKIKTYYTFPNLITIPQRGNISIRQKRANKIENKLKYKFNFNLVEVPADFIKNVSEMRATNLSMGEMLLSERVVKSIYTNEPEPNNKYILHTEPSLPRTLPKDSIKKSITPKLQWYDSGWLKKFIKFLLLLIDFFNIPPIGIEVHPGKSDRKQNNYISFSNALQMVFEEIQNSYHYMPIILIENRTGQFIQDGVSIRDFWDYFKKYFPDLVEYIGIILDIQQFFTVTRNDFIQELSLIPFDSLYGIHIHKKHRAPNLNDNIPWKSVFTFLENIRKDRPFFILPEVHHEKQLIETINFIKTNEFI